jgi:hypothetical protein
MRRILLTALAMVSWSGSVWGQASAPPGNQAELVKTLLERIDKLEQRVSDLEGKLACPSPPCEPTVRAARALEGGVAAKAVAAAQNPAPMPEHEQRPPLPGEQSTFPAMQIRGFADVDFGATDQSGNTSGFTLGQFVLHISSPLSSKVSFFGETSFTAQSASATPPVSTGPVYKLDVERLLLRYDYNDAFKISFGKYHTPINYWNSAYHHGLWLQTTITRPEMVKFGGQFLPVHFVGLLGEGEIPSGPVGLNYQIGMGNGRSFDITRAGDSGDVNNNRAYVANIFSKPVHLPGFQIGASVYGDEITPASGLPRTQELISSAHIVWLHELPEFLGEFANVRHHVPQSGQTFYSQGYYMQMAFRLPWFDKKWKPYYRFEHIHLPVGEPIFTIPNFEGSTAGLRWDFTDFAAFKAEYRQTQNGSGQPRYNGVFVQSSFTF